MHANNYYSHQGLVYLQVLNNCKFHVIILPLRIRIPLKQMHFLSVGMLNLHRPQSRTVTTVSAGASAAKREQCKTNQASASCVDAGWSVCPVAAETTGAWGPSAQKLVRRIARFESMRSGTHVHELSLFICRQLSFTIVGQVGKQLHRASLPAATSTRVPGHTCCCSLPSPGGGSGCDLITPERGCSGRSIFTARSPLLVALALSLLRGMPYPSLHHTTRLVSFVHHSCS